MTEVHAIEWPGISGRKYSYWIYEIGTVFAPAPGNYIFVKEVEPYTWEPVYVGQTSDLHNLPAAEYIMPCIHDQGATHVCVHETGDDEEDRCTEVLDLVSNYCPECNTPQEN